MQLVIVIVISRFQKRYLKARVSKEGVKRSSGPISRIPGGDRLAVKVGAVQMGRVNDQMRQGRRV